jgi:hypothetical protein
MKIISCFFPALCFLLLVISGTEFVQGQETRFSATGVVEQNIVEDKTVRYEYVLAADNGRRYNLRGLEPLDKHANRKVTVTGTLNGNQLNIIDKIKSTEENQSDVPPLPTFGSRKVLVLLVNFINNQSQPVTAEQMRSNIFTGRNSANEFFKEASHYRFNLTGNARPDGDVVGWLTLPFPYTSNPCYLLTNWTLEADELARQRGYESDNYSTVVYVFNTVCDSIYAVATGGRVGDPARKTRVWLSPAAANDVTTIIHEIGHNLGLDHATAFACPGTNIPDCQTIEYGDIFDSMGSSLNPTFFNNYFRLSLGWLTGRRQVVTTSGDYTLMPPSVPTKGNQILQIPLKHSDGELTGYSYFLEFRRPVRFNIPFPFDDHYSHPVYNGVSIRYALNKPQGYRSHLIDSRPNTPNFFDAPLTVGNTYTDARHGITITTLNTNPLRGARVRIQFSR